MSYNYVNLNTISLERDIVPQEYRQCSSDFIECRVQKYLVLVVAPLLMLTSVTGNSLTLAVMLRPTLRTTGTAILFAALAVSDTVANLTGLIRHVVFKATQVDVRHLSPASCVIQRFLLYLSLDTSSWLLVLLTVDRYVAVCHPTYYSYIRRPSTAVWAVSAVLAVQVTFSMHVFWTRGTETIYREYNASVNTTNYYTLHCGYTSESAHRYWAFYQGWISMVMYCLLPFTLLFVLNCLIIRRLKKMTRDGSASSRPHPRLRSQLSRRAASMTRMLLAVSIYFSVVTTPVFIFTMVEGVTLYGKVSGQFDAHRYAKMELIDASTTLLLYLNHSINFFLYCLAGRRFKKELRLLFGCTSTRSRSRHDNQNGCRLEAIFVR